MADKSHLRTSKDYSNEVLEQHVKTMIYCTFHMRKTCLRLTLDEEETANM